MDFISDPLVHKVIGLAIEVHKELGPGLLESAYNRCLSFEFERHRIAFRSEVPLPLSYRGIRLDCGYRLDLLVENRLVVEVKSIERILPIHPAQVITYVRLARAKQGIIFNFNVARLKDGIKSIILPEPTRRESNTPSSEPREAGDPP